MKLFIEAYITSRADAIFLGVSFALLAIGMISLIVMAIMYFKALKEEK